MPLFQKFLIFLLSVFNGQTFVACRRRSVCRPSRRHISKTKQDSPIVTTEHYIEVATADSVDAYRSFPRCPPGKYSGFK